MQCPRDFSYALEPFLLWSLCLVLTIWTCLKTTTFCECHHSLEETTNFFTGDPGSCNHPVKKRSMLLRQVNDKEVSLRLVIFGSKVQLFRTQITEQTGRGGAWGVTPLTYCVGWWSCGQGPNTEYLIWLTCETWILSWGILTPAEWPTAGLSLPEGRWPPAEWPTVGACLPERRWPPSWMTQPLLVSVYLRDAASLTPTPLNDPLLVSLYLRYADPQLNDPLLDHPDEGGEGVSPCHGGGHRDVTVLQISDIILRHVRCSYCAVSSTWPWADLRFSLWLLFFKYWRGRIWPEVITLSPLCVSLSLSSDSQWTKSSFPLTKSISAYLL